MGFMGPRPGATYFNFHSSLPRKGGSSVFLVELFWKRFYDYPNPEPLVCTLS